MIKYCLLSLFILTIVLFSQGVQIKAQDFPQADIERVIIKFKPITPSFLKTKIVNSAGIDINEKLQLSNTYISLVTKEKAKEVSEKLSKNFFIDYAEKDYVAQKYEVPNDPEYLKQWGLDKIQANFGWDVSHGSSSTKIAIVDTGIDYTHPDLSSKIETSVSCIFSTCPSFLTTDWDGHGTHVSGIAAAITNNNIGIAGTAYDTKLMSVKVLDDNGNGYYSWISNGIVWAADNGADVINLSLGGNLSSFTLENAINYAWNKGVVIVAATGNNGSNIKVYPAAYINVIAVAATDQSDTKTNFSNYGSWVDVAAPGLSIYSTYHSGYEYLSGTSMSAPFVSGLAALINAKNPLWSNIQVRQKLEGTCDTIPGTGIYWQYGRINVCRALDCNIAITPSPTTIIVPITTTTPTLLPTASPTSIPTSTSTVTPTPTQVITPTLTTTIAITPTPVALPWWCRYIPTHPYCQR